MPVTGDFNDLEELRRRLDRVGSEGFRRSINAALAEEARTQIVRGFQGHRDPYGNPWAPLRSRSGQPLRNTGNLMNSLHGQATAEGFTVATPVAYAAVHQYGATIHAKTARGLLFRVGGGGRGRGAGGRFTKGGGSWVRKQQVTIPRRQYMPEGELGPIWREALAKVADDMIRAEVGA